MNDELGEQRVEVWVGGIAGASIAVATQAWSGGCFKHLNGTARRFGAAIGVHCFCVDAQLNGVAVRVCKS